MKIKNLKPNSISIEKNVGKEEKEKRNKIKSNVVINFIFIQNLKK